jgi:UDP-glucose 6-dehydrogenase
LESKGNNLQNLEKLEYLTKYVVTFQACRLAKYNHLVINMTIENATIDTTKKFMSSLINDVEALLKVSHVELIQTLSKFACKHKPLSFVTSSPLLQI